MMNNEKLYRILELRLLNGRVNGTISEAKDDELLEEMDDLWWKLTEEEQVRANKRTAQFLSEQKK